MPYGTDTERPSDIPELAIVRALTSGGPYAAGDAISVAFTAPDMGRLVRHDRATYDALRRNATSPLLPETISVVVVAPAGPYAAGDFLTLSFVDPAIARIHALVRTEPARVERRGRIGDGSAGGTEPNADGEASALHVSLAAAEPAAPAAPAGTASCAPFSLDDDRARDAVTEALLGAMTPRAEPSGGDSHGVRCRLSWTHERTRRFVQVVDKLFTVDRLGWYRHVFAMRLLVPDEIRCGDATADAEAMRHLRSLRSAVLETLGRPLLAAYMPAFTVTSEWLDTLDSVEAAQALGGLRATLLPFVRDDARGEPGSELVATCGMLGTRDLDASAASVEALLPRLIPSVSIHADVTERLSAYRLALIELFAETAHSAEAVRLGQMTQPNHVLDDRLWQLVGTVGERFGGLAVA